MFSYLTAAPYDDKKLPDAVRMIIEAFQVPAIQENRMV